MSSISLLGLHVLSVHYVPFYAFTFSERNFWNTGFCRTKSNLLSFLRKSSQGFPGIQGGSKILETIWKDMCVVERALSRKDIRFLTSHLLYTTICRRNLTTKHLWKLVTQDKKQRKTSHFLPNKLFWNHRLEELTRKTSDYEEISFCTKQLIHNCLYMHYKLCKISDVI